MRCDTSRRGYSDAYRSRQRHRRYEEARDTRVTDTLEEVTQGLQLGREARNFPPTRDVCYLRIKHSALARAVNGEACTPAVRGSHPR